MIEALAVIVGTWNKPGCDQNQHQGTNYKKTNHWSVSCCSCLHFLPLRHQQGGRGGVEMKSSWLWWALHGVTDCSLFSTSFAYTLTTRAWAQPFGHSSPSLSQSPAWGQRWLPDVPAPWKKTHLTMGCPALQRCLTVVQETKFVWILSKGSVHS